MPTNTLKIEDSKHKLTIESTISVYITETTPTLLLAYAETMHNIVPLESIKIDFVPGPPPGHYNYTIETVDNRSWEQEFSFAGGNLTAPAQMTFHTTDKWKLEEFAAQRPIRDILLDFITKRGATKITLNWL
jgi:hypothetical protein